MHLKKKNVYELVVEKKCFGRRIIDIALGNDETVFNFFLCVFYHNQRFSSSGNSFTSDLR